jgi:hypothetical protein
MMQVSFWSKKGAETLSRRSARERGNFQCKKRGRGSVLSSESSPEVVRLSEIRGHLACSLVARRSEKGGGERGGTGALYRHRGASKGAGDHRHLWPWLELYCGEIPARDQRREDDGDMA